MCLLNPADVVLDSNRNIYIADAANYRVQYWSNGSSIGITIAGNSNYIFF